MVYSGEQLFDLKNSGNYIKRSLRKDLFKLHLWCPSNSRLHISRKAPKSLFSRCALLNPWSVNNKESAIRQFVTEEKIEFLAITETWLSDIPSVANVNIARLVPEGYSFHHTPRKGRAGGGVGLIYSLSFTARRRSISVFTTFEAQVTSLRSDSSCILVAVVYHNKGTFSELFADEFAQLISFLDSQRGRPIILADLNFHLDDDLNVPANKFKALLESLNLIQHVSGPKHQDGHSLDVIITHEDLKISDITTPHA